MKKTWGVVGLTTVLSLFFISAVLSAEYIESRTSTTNSSSSTFFASKVRPDMYYHQLQMQANASANATFVVYVNTGAGETHNAQALYLNGTSSNWVNATGMFNSIRLNPTTATSGITYTIHYKALDTGGN